MSISINCGDCVRLVRYALSSFEGLKSGNRDVNKASKYSYIAGDFGSLFCDLRTVLT